MLYYLILCLASPVFARDFPGDGPGPGRPPRCDIGRVNACVSAHQQAAAEARGRVAQRDLRMAALRADLEALSASGTETESELVTLRAEHFLLTAEAQALASPAAPPARAPLEDFPALEDFFGLPAQDRLWLERYPEERKEKLTSRLRENEREKTEWLGRIEKISHDINLLDDEFQSEKTLRDSAQGEVSQHDSMCTHGCHDEICPYGN